MAASQRLYRQIGSLEGLLRFVEASRASDRAAESTISSGNKLGCGSLIVAGIGGLLAWQVPEAHTAGVALGGTGLAAFTGATVYTSYKSQFDLDNSKTEGLSGLLRALQVDAAPGKDWTFEWDLRPADRPANLKLKTAWYTPFFGSKCIRTFQQTYVSLRGRLADGSTLCLELDRRGSQKSKSKRKGTRRTARFRDRCRVWLMVPEAEQGKLDRFYLPTRIGSFGVKLARAEGRSITCVFESNLHSGAARGSAPVFTSEDLQRLLVSVFRARHQSLRLANAPGQTGATG